MATINERIKEVRRELGLTQAKFAKAIGLKTGTVGMYDSNARNVTEQSIMLICKQFNVREEWLRDGDGPMFGTADVAQRLQGELGLGRDDARLIRTFLSFPPEDRARILAFAREFIARYTADSERTETDDERLDREEREALERVRAEFARQRQAAHDGTGGESPPCPRGSPTSLTSTSTAENVA